MIGMDGTDTRDPRRGNANRKVPVRMIASILLGVVVIAAAAVSVWFAVGPRGEAVMPEPKLVGGGERAFKLIPYSSSRPLANVEFEDGQGKKRTLADFRGKVVLLNVWATWCGPCRKEMPTLDRLQQRLGSAEFEVVALSIDRGGQAAVKSFFDECDRRGRNQARHDRRAYDIADRPRRPRNCALHRAGGMGSPGGDRDYPALSAAPTQTRSMNYGTFQHER